MCVPPIDMGPFKDLTDARDTREDRYDDLPATCPRCSHDLSHSIKECPICGMEFGLEKKEKNGKIAALASLVFPGLGQFYNDQMAKAMFFFILGIFSALYIYYYIIGFLVLFPMIFIFIFWAYNVYDAFSMAGRTSDGWWSLDILWNRWSRRCRARIHRVVWRGLVT